MILKGDRLGRTYLSSEVKPRLTSYFLCFVHILGAFGIKSYLFSDFSENSINERQIHTGQRKKKSVFVISFIVLLSTRVCMSVLKRKWIFETKRLSERQLNKVRVNAAALVFMTVVWVYGVKCFGVTIMTLFEHSDVCFSLLSLAAAKGKIVSGTMTMIGPLLMLSGYVILLLSLSNTKSRSNMLSNSSSASSSMEVLLTFFLCVMYSIISYGRLRMKGFREMASELGGVQILDLYSLDFSLVCMVLLIATSSVLSSLASYLPLSLSFASSLPLFFAPTATSTVAGFSAGIPHVLTDKSGVGILGWVDFSLFGLFVSGALSTFSSLLLRYFLLKRNALSASTGMIGKKWILEGDFVSAFVVSILLWSTSSTHDISFSHSSSNGQGEASMAVVAAFLLIKGGLGMYNSKKRNQEKNDYKSSSAENYYNISLGDGSANEYHGSGSGLVGSRSIINPIVREIRKMMQFILSTRRSRTVFAFLSLNFLFMLVEICVGKASNSLGLIGDAGHMLFDNTALFIGLLAAYVAQSWRPNGAYTYGYLRCEVLAAFTNAIFLVFVGVMLFIEALERFYEPPKVATDKHLLATSVIGFFVNMIGVTMFHDVGNEGETATANEHNSNAANLKGEIEVESGIGENYPVNNYGLNGVAMSAGAQIRLIRGTSSCSFSQGSCGGCDSKHNRNNIDDVNGGTGGAASVNNKNKKIQSADLNVQGMILHLVADMLGSLSVIVSSLLIQYYNLQIADPVCSLILSCTIVSSAIPLTISCARELSQAIPPNSNKVWDDTKDAIRKLNGVNTIRQAYIWCMKSKIVVTMHLEISPEAVHQNVQSDVLMVLQGLADPGQIDITLQIEKIQ